MPVIPGGHVDLFNCFISLFAELIVVTEFLNKISVIIYVDRY